MTYAHGEEWYSAMHAYVKANIDFTSKFVKENIPDVSMIEPEGTYLVWLDCRKLGLPAHKCGMPEKYA